MKWLEKKEIIQTLINQGISYKEIGRQFSTSGAAIRMAAKRLGIILPKRRRINTKETFNKKEKRFTKCLNCGKDFVVYPSSNGKFCCKKCFAEYRKLQKIQKWQNGEIDGTANYTCINSIRNYMLEKANYKCQKCGWGELNPYTNKVPLHIHHLDGNSLNNKEDNLQVLCPNCHSLTENFGSRNTNAPRGKSAYYGKAKG